MKKVLILTALALLSAASVGCNRDARDMTLLRGTCLGRLFDNNDCYDSYYGGGECCGDTYGGDYYGGEVYGGGCANGQCGIPVQGVYPGGVIQGGVYPGEIIEGVPSGNGSTHPDLQPTPAPSLPGPASTTPNNN